MRDWIQAPKLLAASLPACQQASKPDSQTASQPALESVWAAEGVIPSTLRHKGAALVIPFVRNAKLGKGRVQPFDRNCNENANPRAEIQSSAKAMCNPSTEIAAHMQTLEQKQLP